MGRRKRGKHPFVVASHEPPTGDLTRNPGMCPDWESNGRPFGSQSGAQSTEPPKPGLFFLNLYHDNLVRFLKIKHTKVGGSL